LFEGLGAKDLARRHLGPCPVSGGVEFLLVIDIRRVDGGVCEAVALLPRTVGMNLSRLARVFRYSLATGAQHGLPQSAEEVAPAVISRARLRLAFADVRLPCGRLHKLSGSSRKVALRELPECLNISYRPR
jgi:hypothetical protein